MAQKNTPSEAQEEWQEALREADRLHTYQANRRHFWKVAVPVIVAAVVLPAAGIVAWTASSGMLPH